MVDRRKQSYGTTLANVGKYMDAVGKRKTASKSLEHVTQGRYCSVGAEQVYDDTYLRALACGKDGAQSLTLHNGSRVTTTRTPGKWGTCRFSLGMNV